MYVSSQSLGPKIGKLKMQIGTTYPVSFSTRLFHIWSRQVATKRWEVVRAGTLIV